MPVSPCSHPPSAPREGGSEATERRAQEHHAGAAGQKGFMRSCQQGSAHPSTALGEFGTSDLSRGALRSGCGV